MPPPIQRRRPETPEGVSPPVQRIRPNQTQQPQQAQPASELPEVGKAAAFLNNVGQGLSLNFSDEMAAGASAVVKAPFSERTFGELYAEQLQVERENIRASREQHPLTSLAGGITGAVTTGAGAVRHGASLVGRGAQTLPRLFGKGALEGGLWGFAFGLGSGETARERVEQGARGGALGAATGSLAGLAGGALASVRATRAAESLDELKAASQAAYKASEQFGVAINQTSYRRFLGAAEARLRQGGYRENVSTNVRKVLNEFNREVQHGGPVSLRTLDELRKVARTANSGLNTPQDALLDTLISQLDGFVRGLSPARTTINVGGTAARREAINALNEARGLWGRYARGTTIDDAISRAQTLNQKQGQSLDVALRNQFDAILRNPRRIRYFSQSERDAIRKVVEGGPMDNVYRIFAKLDPINHPFAAGMGAAIGGTAFGPAGAVGVPLAGIGAGRAASALTGTNARLASELVRRGAPTIFPASQATTPTISALASQPDLTQQHLTNRGQELRDALVQGRRRLQGQ